jgi:hypothetical protein
MGRQIADEGPSALALLDEAVPVLFGAVRLGRLAPFCSESVLMGFLLHPAPVIALKQPAVRPLLMRIHAPVRETVARRGSPPASAKGTATVRPLPRCWPS